MSLIIPANGLFCTKRVFINGEEYKKLYTGLIFRDLISGDGKIPEEGQVALIRYQAWYEGGEKAIDPELYVFTLNPADKTRELLVECVLSMRVGGKKRIVIPLIARKHETWIPDFIQKDNTVIFEITLLDVEGDTDFINKWWKRW